MAKSVIALIFAGLFCVACSSAPATRDVEAPEKIAAREGVKAAVQSQMREISGCWKENLRLHPKEEGRLVLQWTIDQAGRARMTATVPEKTTITTRIFQDCVIAQINETQFPIPQPGDEQTIVYPFSFRRLPAGEY